MLCASAAYLDAHGIPEKPEDLVSHQCLTYAYASGNHIWTFARPEGKDTVSVAASGPVHSNNGLLLRELAVQGVGITMAPDFILQSAVDEKRLQPLLPDWALPALTIYAAYPSRKHLSAKVRGFASFLQEWLVQRCPAK
jgi:DNA-binding transcriptional LysR family regulator